MATWTQVKQTLTSVEIEVSKLKLEVNDLRSQLAANDPAVTAAELDGIDARLTVVRDTLRTI